VTPSPSDSPSHPCEYFQTGDSTGKPFGTPKPVTKTKPASETTQGGHVTVETVETVVPQISSLSSDASSCSPSSHEPGCNSRNSSRCTTPDAVQELARDESVRAHEGGGEEVRRSGVGGEDMGVVAISACETLWVSIEDGVLLQHGVPLQQPVLHHERCPSVREGVLLQHAGLQEDGALAQDHHAHTRIHTYTHTHTYAHGEETPGKEHGDWEGRVVGEGGSEPRTLEPLSESSKWRLKRMIS
jgi:hypothetical protein